MRWLFVLLLVGCRPDPGAPDYSGQDEWLAPEDAGDDDDTPDPDFLLGPDPFEDGEARLSLGVFYESGCSVCLQLDDLTSHLYIFANEFTGGFTFSQGVSDERVEGYESDVIQHLGEGWLGGGVHWDDPFDLSSWTTLSVGLRSSAAAFEDLEIHMTGGDGEVAVTVSDYGFEADGDWHQIEVPMSAFAGADLSTVITPFVLILAGGAADDELFVDNLFFTQD